MAKIERQPMSWHEYDIVTTFLHNEILNVVHNTAISKPDKFDKTKYLQGYRYLVESYCKTNNIEYRSVGSTMVVIPSTSNYYPAFLPYHLSYCDIPKLKLILDFHHLNYQGNYYAPQGEFIILVEFMIYRQVRALCLQDKTERLTIMMDWVREMRIENPDLPSALIVRFLKWKDDEKILKSLSEELKVKDFISKKSDFQNVFDKHTECYWLKSPETLAYLIDRLYKLKKIKVEPKGKGHFIVAQQFFYDYSEKVVKKINMKDAKHNLLTRYPEKHSKDKGSIDFILKQVLRLD